MKIFFVLENYLPHLGGAEVVFKNLSERLVQQGHTVDILTHRLPKTGTFEVINGVRVHRVRCLNSRHLFTFAAIPQAIALARSADIIHTTTFNGAPPAWVAARVTGKPVIITVHEVWLNRWREVTNFSPLAAWIYNLLEHCVYALPFDQYVCVSDSTRKRLVHAGIDPNKAITVHNGFDTKFFDPKKYKTAAEKIRKKVGKGFLIFAMGRAGVSKGFEYLIQAMPVIHCTIPDVHLALILTAKQQYPRHTRFLMNEIEKANTQQEGSIITVIEPVKREELGNYICAADCVVVPSIAEGFGYAVLETNTIGTPLVASKVDSIPEVMSGKGRLIQPKSPEAIAEAVLLVKNKKWKIFPKKEFSWETCVTEYESVYQKLEKERPKKRIP